MMLTIIFLCLVSLQHPHRRIPKYIINGVAVVAPLTQARLSQMMRSGEPGSSYLCVRQLPAASDVPWGDRVSQTLASRAGTIHLLSLMMRDFLPCAAPLQHGSCW